MYQGTTASLCVGTNAKAFQASGHAHPVVAETRGRGRRIDLTAVRHEGSSVLSGFNRRRQSSCKADTTLVERWIIAALRHRRFLSIEELSQAIRGQARAEPFARRTVRSESVVPRAGQHRLPHGVRRFYSVPYNLVGTVGSALKVMGTRSPFPSTGHVPTRRIWSGLPPGW